MRTEYLESDPYQRPFHIPETFIERIAWALCAADLKDSDGYLNDSELRGLEAFISKMKRTCGNERAEAEWLGVPIVVARNSIRDLKRLALDERFRRDNIDPLLGAHLTAAYWPDYMAKAKAAWSVMLQDPTVAVAITSAKPPPAPPA